MPWGDGKSQDAALPVKPGTNLGCVGRPVNHRGQGSRRRRSGTIKGFALIPSLIYGKEFPVIARYTRPEMGRIWSDQNKFQTWLDVEIAATETLAEAGIVPQSAAKAM